MSMNRILDTMPRAFQPRFHVTPALLTGKQQCFVRPVQEQELFQKDQRVTCTLVFHVRELFLTTLPINGIHMLNTVAQEVIFHFLVKSGICLMSSLAEDLRSLPWVRGKNTKAFTKPISLSAVSSMLWPFNLIIPICTEPLINAIISWLHADFIKSLLLIHQHFLWPFVIWKALVGIPRWVLSSKVT